MLMDQSRTALRDQLISKGQGPGKGPAEWAQPGDTALLPKYKGPPALPLMHHKGWVSMCWLQPWRCRTR